jgi:hypothetical protein
MGKVIFKELLFEKNRSDELGDLIKQSPVLSKAVRANPALGFSLANAAQAVAGEKELTKKMLADILKSDSQLALAAKDKKFNAALIEFLEAVIKRKLTAKPPGTTPDTPPAEAPPDSGEPDESAAKDSAFELNLEILALLNDIPIAHPGDIITSEHHNSLRRAIRAIAALIDDAELTSIHTFAPIFLPVAFPKQEERSDANWKILFNKAVVPTVQEMGGAGGVVRGAFFVRLPDDVLIKSMIVRGKRLDETAQDPKSFDVTLFRFEPDKTSAKPAGLINADLKDENGVFKRTESPKSSLRVDNAKYQYYVSAVWEDEDDSSGFEIRSVQIFCER